MPEIIDYDPSVSGCLDELKALRPIFILAPREISPKRLVELTKRYLPRGNIVFGIAKEPYVMGFEDQFQFKMLASDEVVKLAGKIERAKTPNSVAVLRYPQSHVEQVLSQIEPKKVVVIRGSYARTFHLGSIYALLKKNDIPFSLVSPFCDEDEALAYLERFEASQSSIPIVRDQLLDDAGVFNLVEEISKKSFDYSFQTGVVLADQVKGGYRPIVTSYNEVIPYQTYALLHGNAREKHKSNLHDINHYDTIHAEMNLLVTANREGISLVGKSLFINLMPCPTCARTLSKTGLSEVIYRDGYSGGYAKKILSESSIKTRKVEA